MKQFLPHMVLYTSDKH